MASQGEFRQNSGVLDRAEEFAAPGRVNLIGEHTDYSGGFVMPVAIDFRTVATIRPRADSKILIRSANLPGEAVYDADKLPTAPRQHWSDYPIGVAWSLAQEGVRLGGFDLSLAGDVPLGAGLSSSASIEVATGFALLSIARAGDAARAHRACLPEGGERDLWAPRAALWTSSLPVQVNRTTP